MTGLKKLSAKTIFGNTVSTRNQMIRDGKTTKDLYILAGVASGFQQGIGEKGPWTALVGEFEATNLENGEQFSAFKCFLPADVTAYFMAALKSNNSAAVEFAVKIGMRLNDTPVGFEFTTTPLVPIQGSSAMEKLRMTVAKALPAALQAKNVEGVKELPPSAPAEKGKGNKK